MRGERCESIACGFACSFPYGGWIGCGTLRVLRLKVHDDESATLTAGYESYRRMSPEPRRARDGSTA